LVVSGTQTTVNSTTVNIADNIIQLNGTGATNAGLVVRDATASTLVSGSLLWNTTTDRWIAGPLGSEIEIGLISAAQTLTNKTISGASNTITNIGNSSLTNSSVTVTAGTGMSGGGAVALGSSVTLTNAGVTSISGTTNQVSVSANTGGVTLSTPQNIHTTATPTFGGLTINGGTTLNSSTTAVTGALIVGGATTSTTVGLIRASNDIIAFASSDERLKTNIEPIVGSLDKIMSIGGYEFDWIPMEGIHDNSGHDIGVIAQEVQKVLPEIVTTRDNGYMAVKYEKMIAVLIEAIKEQQKQIDEIKSKLQ